MNVTPDIHITGPLIALLAVAAWCDVRSFRIPNSITVPGVLLGLALNSLASSGLGFVAALAGFSLALFGLLPLYLLRIWGAGDVKLMAVVGAFVGPAALVGSLLTSLVVGGAIALLVAWQRRRGQLLLENLRRMIYQLHFNAQLQAVEAVDAPAESAGKVAYAVPILLGTTAYLLYVRLA